MMFIGIFETRAFLHKLSILQEPLDELQFEKLLRSVELVAHMWKHPFNDNY